MEGYWLFAAASALSVASPGPDVFAVIGRALGGGARACAGLLLGIAAGKVVLLTAAFLGLVALAQMLGPLFVAVKLAGAAYLVHLGVKLWRRPVDGGDLPGAGPARPSLAGETALGLAMALGNPVAVLFYAAVLPNVLDVGGVTPAGFAGLCAIVVLNALAINGGYALLAGAAGRALRSPPARRLLNRTAGAAMIGAGVAVAAR